MENIFYNAFALGTDLKMSLDKNNSLTSGDLIEVKIKTPAIHQNDEKTGAVIVDIC